MVRNLWSRMVGPTLTLVLALVVTTGLILVNIELSVALFWGWLVGSAICLGMAIWQRHSAWAASGFILLGGALIAALIWRGIADWWWPLGLIALAVIYLALASMLPDHTATDWRFGLETGALFVAGVGAFWALGQVITVYLLATQGTQLLVDEGLALRGSFLLSSVLLVGLSLLWAILRRRLAILALTALLLAQLAAALVINANEIGNPNADALFALSVLVVALACHVGTYPLRFWFPAQSAANTPRPWRHLRQRRGLIRALQTVQTLPNPDAWWLCFLLDVLALLLAALAILPVAGQPMAGSPNSGPLAIVLTAGALLGVAIAYWQQAPWLILLAGVFLAADIYALGLFSTTPDSTRPLLYFAATTGLLGLTIWLRSSNERAWARPSLFVALGFACLALVFALRQHSLAWGLGMALALAVVALLAVWGWRLAQSTS